MAATGHEGLNSYLSRYIADRTGIPVEVVARVLEAEMEYLIERGIAQAER